MVLRRDRDEKETSGFPGSPEGPIALETFLQETAGPSACSPVKSFWVRLELHLRVSVLSFLHRVLLFSSLFLLSLSKLAVCLVIRNKQTGALAVCLKWLYLRLDREGQMTLYVCMSPPSAGGRLVLLG